MENKVINLFAAPAPTATDSGERKFIDVLQEYSKRNIVELNLKHSTKQKYSQLNNNISRFLTELNLIDIPLDQIRVKHMNDLKLWVQTNLKHCCVTHAVRHIEFCKRVLNYAVLQEYCLNNPIAPMKTKRDKTKEVVHLEKSELEALMNFSFANEMFRKVTDLYVFQCYTGLSYADLYTYSVLEKESRLWISNRREKNDNPYYVPLFAHAKIIHERYDGKLPFFANVSYNRYLKEVAKIVGIKKHLTTHTGRKTFATLKDQEGWSSKTIADMMGNTLQVLQKHYLAKSTRRIENELVSLGY